MTISVAVDGPAGAGKSTICRLAAARLGFVYVDTGALYRAVGLHALRRGLDPQNEADASAAIDGLTLDLRFDDGGQRVVINGEDVTDSIRTPEVSMAASAVSAHPPVRAFLLETQRRLAREHSVVMDGRDIGTVVLPQATRKIFLTAPLEVRARRRLDELAEKGQTVSYDDVLRDMAQRDYNDTHRAAAPLRQADDAVVLDNGDCTLEQSVDRMVALIRACMPKGGERA